MDQVEYRECEIFQGPLLRTIALLSIGAFTAFMPNSPVLYTGLLLHKGEWGDGCWKGVKVVIFSALPVS